MSDKSYEPPAGVILFLLAMINVSFTSAHADEYRDAVARRVLVSARMQVDTSQVELVLTISNNSDTTLLFSTVSSVFSRVTPCRWPHSAPACISLGFSVPWRLVRDSGLTYDCSPNLIFGVSSTNEPLPMTRYWSDYYFQMLAIKPGQTSSLHFAKKWVQPEYPYHDSAEYLRKSRCAIDSFELSFYVLDAAMKARFASGIVEQLPTFQGYEIKPRVFGSGKDQFIQTMIHGVDRWVRLSVDGNDRDLCESLLYNRCVVVQMNNNALCSCEVIDPYTPGGP